MPFSIHAYLRQARYRIDTAQFPVSGKTKQYQRMPQLPLSEPVALKMTLSEALGKRRSFSYDKGGELGDLSVADLSSLFGMGLRAREDGTRPHPSGGPLYPLETYFIGDLGKTEKNRGHGQIYHYDPVMHALADLWPMPTGTEIDDFFPEAGSVAPACLVLTGMWGRNALKYGDFGYYLGMLEAGHVAQNILLAAGALGIGARPIGGFDDAAFVKALDINENIEQVVYAIMLGKQKIGEMPI
jgi:SagB-type dehydrogenase family enzyme